MSSFKKSTIVFNLNQLIILMWKKYILQIHFEIISRWKHLKYLQLDSRSESKEKELFCGVLSN